MRWRRKRTWKPQRYTSRKPPRLRALDIAPAVASHHDTLAIVFERMGRLQDAAAAYRRAVELAPEHPDFKTNLQRVEKELASIND